MKDEFAIGKRSFAAQDSTGVLQILQWKGGSDKTIEDRIQSSHSTNIPDKNN
jgi:hypothetical protein